MSAPITDHVDDLTEHMVELYKLFHQTPELSMREHHTAEAITHELRSYGLEPRQIGGTGVVAVIENGDGETVAYRADIDGLPITENTGLDFASRQKGTLPDGTQSDVMHGCGHDTHITVGLALARLLTGHRDAWSGRVVLLFQPGEETSEGAQAMLDDGLWEKLPRPAAVYGQHVWPIAAGTVNISSGTAMAMSDCLRVTVHGVQAHGSQPENAVDPIVLGAYIITRLQTVVSREISGRAMAVLTVGTFHGGLKENIIPDSAEFTLNVRTFDEKVRERVLSAITRIVHAEAEASGAPEPHIEPMYRFPRCYNDPNLTDSLIADLQNELGDENVNVVPPVTGSEDFGRLGDTIDVPYVYWMFGAFSRQSIDDGTAPGGNHTATFAPNDLHATLTTGLRAAATAVTSRLTETG